MRKLLRRANALVVALLAAAALPGSAAAGDLYGSTTLVMSAGYGEAGGSTAFFDNRGDDTDSSPAYGASFGYAVSVDEIFPDRQLEPIEDWKLRSELEGLYGRNYELRAMGAEPYLSRVDIWTLFWNTGVDVPLDRAISSLFGRIPVLEPLSFTLLAGMGLASNDVRTSDNVSSGSTVSYDFAWQASAGFGYALTRHVTLGVAYRYFDPGSVEFPLRAGGNNIGNFELDLSAHEVATSLRLAFYALPLPGR